MKIYSADEIREKLPSKIEIMAARLVYCLTANIRINESLEERGVVRTRPDELTFNEKLDLYNLLSTLGYTLDIKTEIYDGRDVAEKYMIKMKERK